MVTDASHPQGLKGLDKLNLNFFALCVGVSSSRDAISVQLLLFNVCLKSSFSLSMVRILATCELKYVTDLSEMKQNQEILCLVLGVGLGGVYFCGFLLLNLFSASPLPLHSVLPV